MLDGAGPKSTHHENSSRFKVASRDTSSSRSASITTVSGSTVTGSTSARDVSRRGPELQLGQGARYVKSRVPPERAIDDGVAAARARKRSRLDELVDHAPPRPRG